MIPLLLDTHYWFWLQLGTAEHLTDPILKAIYQAAEEGRLLVSIMSVWEIGMLESKRRIELKTSCEQWVTEALATPGLSLVPLTWEIAIESTRLPALFHGDPTDRIIIATARKMGAQLLTRDRKMVEYGRKRHVSIF